MNKETEKPERKTVTTAGEEAQIERDKVREAINTLQRKSGVTITPMQTTMRTMLRTS